MKEDASDQNQATYPPLEDLALVESHVRLVSSTRTWHDVAILVDGDMHACLILMMIADRAVSALRICLSVNDSVTAINLLRKNTGNIFFGCYQGHTITKEDISSISKIDSIWQKIRDQVTRFSIGDVRNFFQRVEE